MAILELEPYLCVPKHIKTSHYVWLHKASQAQTTSHKQEHMARGGSSGPFSFSFMLLLLLWDSLCLWDLWIISGKALFQFWTIVYNFLRHPKLCLSASRHCFKAIGIEGGSQSSLSCRHRCWTCRVLQHRKEFCRGKPQNRPKVGQGKPRKRIREATHLHLQGAGSHVLGETGWKWHSSRRKTSNPQNSWRWVDKLTTRRSQKQVGSNPLSAALSGKHILDAFHWMM